MIQLVQQLPVLYGNCSFISLHHIHKYLIITFCEKFRSSLATAYCIIVFDTYRSPLAARSVTVSLTVRPHERSSCTVNDKSYLSDKMRILYYVSQLQNVYGILAKDYEDYCLPKCFEKNVLPSLPRQDCCVREVFLKMLPKFLSQHTSGLSRKRWHLRSGLMVSCARKLKSSRKSLAGWWQSNLGSAVEGIYSSSARQGNTLHCIQPIRTVTEVRSIERLDLTQTSSNKRAFQNK